MDRDPGDLREGLRCPYCHDDLTAASDPWVACATCLARHHHSCWSESDGCASCRSLSGLLPARALQEARLRLLGAALGALTAVALLLAGGAAWQGCQSTPQAHPAASRWEEVRPYSSDGSSEVPSLLLATALRDNRALQARLDADEARREADRVELDLVRAERDEALLATQALNQRLALLGDQLEKQRAWIGGPPVPAIDAQVVAVKNDVQPGLVLLSVGSDDLVEQGFQFSIYREQTFVGKVVVERVLRDSAGCRLLFTAEGENVRPGDKAATRLH